MQKDLSGKEEEINLKHDTMEFSASSEGEDKLDTDDERYEEEGISAEELNALNDTDENEAAALIAESNDFLADDSNLPNEDWTDDLPDNIDEEEKQPRL